MSSENRSTDLKATVRRHRDEIDDYLGTVRALYALAISACWDEEESELVEGGRWGIPRRMDMAASSSEEDSDDDPTSPTDPLTPDAVIQVGSEYGLVAEAKKNFSSRSREAVLEQIKKYDAELIGWWNDDERIGSHDLALLSHIVTSADAREAYQEWDEAGALDRPLAVIEFVYHQTGQVWLLLRKIAGHLTDPNHDAALHRGKNIEGAMLLELFQKWKFLDDDPPVMHTMLLIHDYVLPTLVTEHDFDPVTGGRIPVAEASIDKLRTILSRQFCEPPTDQRAFELPRRRWVRDAVREFVRAGLAAETEDGVFRFPLRRPSTKDSLEYLSSRMLSSAADEAAVDERQVDLFDDLEESRDVL